MRLSAISPRSSFIQSESIKAYHSAFFHGVSGRDGEWFPSDASDIDAGSLTVSPLDLRYNRFRHSAFTWPGYWPVVDGQLRDKLASIETVHLKQVRVDKVIDVQWHEQSPISIEPGDLTAIELYERFPAVDCTHGAELFELLTFRLRDVVEQFKSTKMLTIETGTRPFIEKFDAECSAAMFNKFQVLSFFGTLICVDNVFLEIEPYIHASFFNVRFYEID